ncbi:MAG TPA: efflux transporter outer membrane subunit [Steroidobacteraceae bacterium]|nr:efflux transporter outer membrane subunit [Steroidobacteraceae bacterium]
MSLRLPAFLLALTASLVAACAAGPNYRTPQVPTPGGYAETAGGATPAGPAAGGGNPAPAAVDLAAWWRALQDPELDSLVERAVTGNPDVLIALDRLQAARTFEAAIIGTVLPVADAAGGGGRGTGSDLARGRAPQTQVSATNGAGLEHINEVGGFDAFWELDVFGKYRREIEAARYDTEATRAARNSVLVSVIADVARAYVDLRGLQVRASVLRSAIAVLRESLRIVSIRYDRGITNELDVTIATRELATLEAQASPVDAQVRAAEYAIAVLLGAYPEEMVKELSAAAMVPSVPGAVAVGLPVELLRRRPDIQQAERELAGANARIGIATADLFPSIFVSGSVGMQRQDAPGLPIMGQHIWSAGPGAFWPLLDFGQLDAQVEIATLQTRALLVSYKRTIQEAVREVDSSAGLYAAQQLSLVKLETALTASQRAVTLANERYERGLTDYLNVVDAERQEYDIEERYAATQVAAAEEFIALYRSLGGGWESYQNLPPIHRPLPAVIAMFQRTLSRSDALR